MFIKNTKVTLSTKLDTSGWGDKSLSWFVKRLTYIWFIPFFMDPKHVGEFAKREIHFDLFSRKFPTLFGVTLDEEFDELWMHGTDSNVTELARVYLATPTAPMH